MQGRHSAISIAIDDHTRATLTGWLRKQKTPVGLAKRARAMLLLADGQTFAAPRVRWPCEHAMDEQGPCASWRRASRDCLTKNAWAGGPFLPPTGAL